MHSGRLANKGDDNPSYHLLTVLIHESLKEKAEFCETLYCCVCVCVCMSDIFMPCEDIVSCKGILGLCV